MSSTMYIFLLIMFIMSLYSMVVAEIIIKGIRNHQSSRATIKDIFNSGKVILLIIPLIGWPLFQYYELTHVVPNGTYEIAVLVKAGGENDYHESTAVVVRNSDGEWELHSFNYNGITYSPSDSYLEENSRNLTTVDDQEFSIKTGDMTAKELGISASTVFKNWDILDKYAPIIFILIDAFDVLYIISNHSVWVKDTYELCSTDDI